MVDSTAITRPASKAVDGFPKLARTRLPQKIRQAQPVGLQAHDRQPGPAFATTTAWQACVPSSTGEGSALEVSQRFS